VWCGFALALLKLFLKAENAIVHMYETFKKAGKVTLIATGCLTNIAALFSVFPDVVNYIEEVSILGGAVHDPAGNIGVCAEFNILLGSIFYYYCYFYFNLFCKILMQLKS
jgi:inosine-uridine nucleoside N-ribohydrolase